MFATCDAGIGLFSDIAEFFDVFPLNAIECVRCQIGDWEIVDVCIESNLINVPIFSTSNAMNQMDALFYFEPLRSSVVFVCVDMPAWSGTVF